MFVDSPYDVDYSLAKVDSFLKPFFLEFYETLNENDQVLLLETQFYNKNPQTVHHMFVKQVQKVDEETGGLPELKNTVYRVLHHIQPRFDGGTDVLENRVLLHQYQHALIHLFRYAWKKLPRDFNAFSSACLTKDQLEKRSPSTPSEASLEARRKTVQNAEWQASAGARGRLNRTSPPAATPALRRSGSKAGKKYQWQNGRTRADVFVWFLCTLTLGFKNVVNQEVLWIPPDTDLKKHTVTDVCQALVSNPMHTETGGIGVIRTRLSNFSQLFRGERQIMWNWKLYGIQFLNTSFVFSDTTTLETLRSFFADVFFDLLSSDSPNIQELKLKFKKYYLSSKVSYADTCVSLRLTKEDNIGDDETFECLFEGILEFTQMYKAIFPEFEKNWVEDSPLVKLSKFCNNVNDRS